MVTKYWPKGLYAQMLSWAQTPDSGTLGTKCFLCLAIPLISHPRADLQGENLTPSGPDHLYRYAVQRLVIYSRAASGVMRTAHSRLGHNIIDIPVSLSDHWVETRQSWSCQCAAGLPSDGWRWSTCSPSLSLIERTPVRKYGNDTQSATWSSCRPGCLQWRKIILLVLCRKPSLMSKNNLSRDTSDLSSYVLQQNQCDPNLELLKTLVRSDDHRHIAELRRDSLNSSCRKFRWRQCIRLLFCTSSTCYKLCRGLICSLKARDLAEILKPSGGDLLHYSPELKIEEQKITHAYPRNWTSQRNHWQLVISAGCRWTCSDVHSTRYLILERCR